MIIKEYVTHIRNLKQFKKNSNHRLLWKKVHGVIKH